jgi:hypothetical protein
MPDTRRKAGDLMCQVWEGANTDQIVFERDQTPHEPMSFE